MYIKHLIGARRGDVEDLPFTIAREKVLRGDAEDVYDQLGIKAVAVPQPQVVSTRADVSVTRAEVARQQKAKARK